MKFRKTKKHLRSTYAKRKHAWSYFVNSPKESGDISVFINALAIHKYCEQTYFHILNFIN